MANLSVPQATSYTFILVAGEFEEITRDALAAIPPGCIATVYDLRANALLGAVHPPSPFVAESAEGAFHLPIEEIRDHLAPESLPELVHAYLSIARLPQDEIVRYTLRYTWPGWVPFRLNHELRPLWRMSDGTVRIVIATVEIVPDARTDANSMPSA